MEAERSMVRARGHRVAATKDHGSRARPSQLIASVRRTLDGRRQAKLACASAFYADLGPGGSTCLI